MNEVKQRKYTDEYTILNEYGIPFKKVRLKNTRGKDLCHSLLNICNLYPNAILFGARIATLSIVIIILYCYFGLPTTVRIFSGSDLPSASFNISENFLFAKHSKITNHYITSYSFVDSLYTTENGPSAEDSLSMEKNLKIDFYDDSSIGGQHFSFDFYREIEKYDDDIDGLISLSFSYYHGIGVPQSYECAFALFDSIAKYDKSGWGDFMKGFSYEYGKGVAKNPHKAFKSYEISAEKGNVNGKIGHALCHLNGIGVKQNPHEAFCQLEKISEIDESGSAHFLIGLCYEEGVGASKNDRAAFGRYEMAASQGNVAGRFKVALCYYEGIGVNVDYRESFGRFAEISKEYDEGLIYFMMALCMEKSKEERDLQEARKYFLLSSEKNYLFLLNEALFCYTRSIEEKDYNRSLTLFKLVADNDPTGESYKFIGDIYRDGNVGKADPRRAVKFYKLSVEKGNIEAHLRLALCYQNNIGVKQNYEEALKLLNAIADRASDRISGQAYAAMGDYYKEGFGGEVDLDRAFDCYEISAEKGSVKGKFRLAHCYFDGTGTVIDYTKSRTLFEEIAQIAEDEMSGVAYFSIARIYDEGLKVEKNPTTAFEYLKLSAEKGCFEAKYQMAKFYLNGHGVISDRAEAIRILTEIKPSDESEMVSKLLDYIAAQE